MMTVCCTVVSAPPLSGQVSPERVVLWTKKQQKWVSYSFGYIKFLSLGTWCLFPVHNLIPEDSDIIKNTAPSASNADWPTNLHDNGIPIINSNNWNSWRKIVT